MNSYWRMRLRYGLAVLAILLVPLFTAFGQINCPQDDGPCGEWSEPFTVFIPLSGGCNADVEVETRECNGVWEFRYTVATISGTCNLLAEFDLEQYSFSALKDFLDLAIIKQAEDPPFNMTIPLCSNPDASKKKIIKMYSAACGVWVKCTYEVSSREPIFCDGGVDPHQLPGNTLDRWEFKPCGETCCTRTYEVCKTTGPNVIHIGGLTAAQVGDCSLQSQFPNNPCQSGCEYP